MAHGFSVPKPRAMTIQPSFVGKRLEGRGAGVASPDRLGRLSGDVVARDGALQHAHLAIEHRDVDGLPFAAALALVERGEDAHGGEQPRRDVAVRDSRPDGATARLAGDRHNAAHGLHDDVQRRPLTVRSCLSEAGCASEDDAWIARGESLVADAELVERAGREVLHHDVDLLREAQEQVPPFVGLQVDGDGALPAVDAEEVRAPVVLVWARGAGDVAVGRPLDLDHVGAEVAQHHGGVGPGEHPREVEDLDVF